MTSPSAITLHLTAAGIEAYCRDLARRVATPEKHVAALDALITFLASQADAGEQAKSEYTAIRHTLLTHFEQARTALLDERARLLQQALIQHQLSQLAGLYTSLSRDAFWTLLERIERELPHDALQALRGWAAEWMQDVQQRAQQASPYPDAIDFTAAGIDATEYLVMSDLSRFLGVAGRPA